MTTNTLKTNPKTQTQIVRKTEFKGLHPELARLHALHLDPGIVGILVDQWARTLPPLYAHLALLSSYALTLEESEVLTPRRIDLVRHFLQRIADLVNGEVPAPTTYAEAHEYILRRLGDVLRDEEEEDEDNDCWSLFSA